MDVVGGYIGLAIVTLFALFFAIFGGIEEEKPISHRVSKKR